MLCLLITPQAVESAALTSPQWKRYLQLCSPLCHMLTPGYRAPPKNRRKKKHTQLRKRLYLLLSQDTAAFTTFFFFFKSSNLSRIRGLQLNASGFFYALIRRAHITVFKRVDLKREIGIWQVKKKTKGAVYSS